MERLDEMEVYRKELLELDKMIAVLTTITQQIEIVERLMHQHRDLVKCPLSYNMSAGLIDQLKVQSMAAFGAGGLAPEIPTEDHAPHFDPKPLFG